MTLSSQQARLLHNDSWWLGYGGGILVSLFLVVLMTLLWDASSSPAAAMSHNLDREMLSLTGKMVTKKDYVS